MMKKICACLTCLALSFLLFACGDSRQSSEPAKEKSVAADISTVEKKSASPVKGKVVETVNAGSYTYIRLEDGNGTELWAAVPKTDLTAGEEITLQGGDMVMENFVSNTLGRTFDKIVFATGVSRAEGQGIIGGGAVDDTGKTMMQGSTGEWGGSAANIVPFADVMVEKALGPDGHSVGEMFEKASELDGRNVVVRGQVVKVSKNIMNRNWIHIQDGTGDPDQNTHDLVVTTMDTAETGDIVTVEGRCAADRDFGFEYRYDVIIEDAKISKVEVSKQETI